VPTADQTVDLGNVVVDQNLYVVRLIVNSICTSEVNCFLDDDLHRPYNLVPNGSLVSCLVSNSTDHRKIEYL
jgi:hypothetical protein